jgi:pyruvate dehydrogenase E2 component (dihydrolipoamide acetyltransferase)
MPVIALASDEVVVQKWLVMPGDAFAAGDPILEVETDKASADVEAAFDGVLVESTCDSGDVVVAGAVIGYASEAGTLLEDARDELSAIKHTAPGDDGDRPARVDTFAPVVDSGASAADHTAGDLVRPIDVPHGELAGLSHRSATRHRLAQAAPVLWSPDTPRARHALSRRRQAIGRSMTPATSVPTFAVTKDVSIASAASPRDLAEHARVTLTDMLLRACGVACNTHPRANAWLFEDTVFEFEHVNVAVAVDTPEGVLAPVVKRVEELGLHDIGTARRDLVERARAGRLDPDDLIGATMTLSNLAGLGAHAITPVLTVPQVIALGVGTSRVLGDDEVISVTLVADHRALDGGDGARFLATFADALADTPQY